MVRVRRIVLNVHTVRKRMFWSQIFDNAFGHLKLNPLIRIGFLPTLRPMGPSNLPRWIHSPKKGNGQTQHQTRDANGIIKVISRNHQKIHTIVIRIFRLPMGEPANPEKMNSVNTSRLRKANAFWSQGILINLFIKGKVFKISQRQGPLGSTAVPASPDFVFVFQQECSRSLVF